MLSQEAYILFYARQGTPWFSTAIEVKMPCADPGIYDTSPKSVLDNVECPDPQPQVENGTDCGDIESKDLADKRSTEFSCKTQFEVEFDDPCVVAEGVSGVPANKSGFLSRPIDSRDDNIMIDASGPPGSSNCSDEFDQNKFTAASHLGKNNINKGVDKDTNDSGKGIASCLVSYLLCFS